MRAADTIQAAVDELPILQSLGWLSEYRLAAAQFAVSVKEIDPPEEGPGIAPQMPVQTQYGFCYPCGVIGGAPGYWFISIR